MPVRIQVVLDKMERERFRQQASRASLSLSAWLREAGREKAASQEAKAPTTLSELRSFFKQCDTREKLREPNWAEHRAVMERSVSRGQSGT